MAQTGHSLDMGGGGNDVFISAGGFPVSIFGNFTVVVWVKPTSFGTIVLCGQGSKWRLQLTGGGNPRYNDGSADNTFTTLTLSTAAWTAMALKVSGTVAKCFIRPSGGSSSNETINPTGAITTGGNTFGMGDYAFGAFTLSGKQTYIQVYTSALADADVEGLIAGTTLPGTLSPVLFWKTDDGSGGTAVDSSGNAYDGTLSGVTWSTDVPTELAGSPPPPPPATVPSLMLLGVG